MVKASVPILEQSCPACGGRFTIGSAGRRKKVQCPQCREVVTLTPPGELNGTPDLPAAPDWMARCEMLQARLEALEQQVEALTVAPRMRSPLIAERLHDFSPVSRDDLLPDDPPEAAEGARREVFRTETPADEPMSRALFARNFQPPSSDIGLLLTAGDEAARRLAGTLTEILARAGWKVRAVTEDRAAAHGRSGLTLVAAETLPLHRITGTLKALREAGLAVAFQLDPERRPNETVLIVQTGAGSENEAGPKG